VDALITTVSSVRVSRVRVTLTVTVRVSRVSVMVSVRDRVVNKAPTSQGLPRMH